MFGTFVQNNSGGWFQDQPQKGIGHYVIVEGKNARAVNRNAKKIGLYFHGTSYGYDCTCCGDRWYEVSDSDLTEHPELYGERVDKGTYTCKYNKGQVIYIHYLRGRGVQQVVIG